MVVGFGANIPPTSRSRLPARHGQDLLCLFHAVVVLSRYRELCVDGGVRGQGAVGVA
jgi:hypothetical protein